MRCFLWLVWVGKFRKHNILAQSTTLLFQKCSMMIVLNGLDKFLSHEGDIILEYRENSTKEKTLKATLHVYIDKCSLFRFNCLSVPMEIIAREESRTWPVLF